jgi:hypothetical protein
LRKSSSIPDEGEYKGVLDAFEQIYNKEGGLSAFYTGVLHDTGKSIADSFLFFLFYNYLRSNRLQKSGAKATNLPVLVELAVGALAGACSKFFTTPISNIVTRKQTSYLLSARSSSPTTNPPSVSEIAKSIRAEKGLQGFWSGYSASLILTLNPSITFFLYESFKRAFVPRAKHDDPGARLTFLMAAMSKAIASTITYPFSLAKARAQASSPPVDPESAEKVRDEVEHAHNKSEAGKTERDAKNIAKRTTVFNTILQIYRTEGAAALYEGVWGEIYKGFFSHGITMIVKESIHRLIIQIYYMILKALNKYPSPSKLANQASVAIQDAGEKAGGMVKEGYKDVAERVGDMVESGKEAIGVGADGAGVVGSNVTELAKNAGSVASKEAGHLLRNAQEQLGEKIDDAGKRIKPEK